MVCLGIDLGTSYCTISVLHDGKIKMIPDRDGNVLVPNYIAFCDGKYLAGNEARNKASSNPKNTVYDIMRFLGQNTDDSRIRNLMKLTIFKMSKSDDKPYVQVECDGELQSFSPEELLCLLLRELKEYAENYLDCPVDFTIISTATDLNRWQTFLVKEAAYVAGFNVIKVTSSQKAAALVYACKSSIKTPQKILIIDIGGASTVASIFNIQNSSVQNIMSSSITIGGEDFDSRILNYLVEEFKQIHRKDIRLNISSLTRLKAAAETAKITLSSKNTAVISLDDILDGICYNTSISRIQFENLCCDFFWDIIKPIEEVLSETNLDKNCLDDIILLGGSSQIPKIRELLQDYFPRKTLDLSLNPLESAACGCALLGKTLNENSNEIRLIESVPYPLGIETAGGVMTKIVEKNLIPPVSFSKTFTTFNDDEDIITILIYEGVSTMTRYNILLGTLTISGLPLVPRGVPRIEVTFNLDENFVLTVNAREIEMGHFGETTIRDVKVTGIGEKEIVGTQLISCR